jgi:hypothetical protein
MYGTAALAAEMLWHAHVLDRRAWHGPTRDEISRAADAPAGMRLVTSPADQLAMSGALRTAAARIRAEQGET